jgi:hypothetical protein
VSDATEKVIDTAADVVADVAQQAGEVEHLIRSLNRAKVQFYLLGMVVGGITGAAVTYKLVSEKMKTKYSQIADEEIDEMRRHYREKTRAAEATAAKRPLEDLIEEQGYSSSENTTSDSPPMAVQPPVAVVRESQDGEADDEADGDVDDEDAEDEDAEEEPPFSEVRRIFQEEQRQRALWVAPEWNYHEELRKRSPDAPYVIHYDERHEMSYQDMTLTYWDKDDVLSNERDEVIDPDERSALIGEDTLNRFGHGSGDRDIVFARNDKMELIFEICRSPNSFAEEVHGFSHDDLSHGNLERMRVRERDEPYDD